MRGVAYSLASVTPEDIKPGNFVKFRRGNATRRILCLDGNEVILRGTRSSGVFEAVDTDKLISEWQLMIPSKQKEEKGEGAAPKKSRWKR